MTNLTRQPYQNIICVQDTNCKAIHYLSQKMFGTWKKKKKRHFPHQDTHTHSGITLTVASSRSPSACKKTCHHYCMDLGVSVNIFPSWAFRRKLAGEDAIQKKPAMGTAAWVIAAYTKTMPLSPHQKPFQTFPAILLSRICPKSFEFMDINKLLTTK